MHPMSSPSLDARPRTKRRDSSAIGSRTVLTYYKCRLADAAEARTTTTTTTTRFLFHLTTDTDG